MQTFLRPHRTYSGYLPVSSTGLPSCEASPHPFSRLYQIVGVILDYSLSFDLRLPPTSHLQLMTQKQTEPTPEHTPNLPFLPGSTVTLLI